MFVFIFFMAMIVFVPVFVFLFVFVFLSFICGSVSHSPTSTVQSEEDDLSKVNARVPPPFLSVSM